MYFDSQCGWRDLVAKSFEVAVASYEDFSNTSFEVQRCFGKWKRMKRAKNPILVYGFQLPRHISDCIDRVAESLSILAPS